MSYTLSVGSDGSATTAQVVWSVNGQTYKFRSDNNFISWITTIFDVADSLNIIGGLDLLLTDQIPPVQGGTGNLYAKYGVGASVAGNARGLGAVDLQQYRNNATEVASADFATVGGGRNNTASGYYATVGGGRQNTASGIYATVGGGSGNTASSNFATVGGGLSALADRYGQTANASGNFSTQGDAQAVSFVMRNTTSGATTANLKLDGITVNLTIPSGKLLSGIINISGIDSTGAEVLNYIKQFSIKNVGGTTTLVHQAVIGTNHRDNAALDAVISADNVNDCLQVACTGRAGFNFRWVAVVTGLEIAYG